MRVASGRDHDAIERAAGRRPNVDTQHLGLTLRSVYEREHDGQPIPDGQVELLLRLRQKERDLRRAG